MQMCPNCERVYDESEDYRCPYCHDDWDTRETRHIVYDSDRGEALSLSDSEYEEFKKTHPEYR